MAQIVVHFDLGKPFPTDTECPNCGFDSVVAVLTIIGGVPDFAYWCGRTVCREANPSRPA